MTTIRKIVALSAAVVGLALCPSVFAQDDLDDLLKDLESEQEAAEAAAEEAAPAEATAAAETPAEVAEADDAEEPAEAAEEAAEEPAADETTAEEPAAEEPAAEEPAAAEEAEEPAAEEPIANEKVDDVLSTLDALAEEVEAAKKPEAPKAAEEPAAEPAEEPAAEEAAEEPAAEEPAAEEPAAPKAEAPKAEAVKANPDAELIANLVTTERVRRQALDSQAKREINEARQCMKDGEYTDAVRHYGNAAKLLNDRASVKNLRKECEQGIAEGLYRAAVQENDIGRRDRAVQMMEKALEMRHPRAHRMLEKWADETAGAADKKDDASEYRHRKHDEDYKTEREQIRRHLKRATQYLSLRDMDKALEECEVVLKNDPYNQQAIRIRKAIQTKRQTILRQERAASREGMIADVDEAWRPVYAVNASQLGEQASETVKAQTGEDPERTMEQDIERRMKEMKLPNISFKPPATIVEAVEFFRQASKDYDRPEIPAEKRGFNFVLRTPVGAIKQQVVEEEESDDFSSNGDEAPAGPTNGLEPIQTITASDITFHEALKLVCDSVQYKFIVRGQVVMVMPVDMSTAELIARKYNVPEAFVERVNNAKDEIKTMGGFGASNRSKKAEEEEGEEQDWKAFFEEMGVKWPEGSSIKHIKALGKLYVRNTRENLAEFEKVLDELGGQPQLIEIETRFVEVSQEDLNSLGFEWLLNSDYTLNLGDQLGKALGVRNSAWGEASGSNKWSSYENFNSDGGYTTGFNGKPISLDGFPSDYKNPMNVYKQGSSYSTTFNESITPYSRGGNLIRTDKGVRGIGINAMGGENDFGMNNRYLSTMGNHISGQGQMTNDQFMRVNAFLGNADLSMILHMLAQRSDTDLLSAPKIVTKSGENAVIKVVTEFIYPQDYDVQLQSSSSSGNSNSGSQSAVLAIVEPQNFTMREVGVILDVTPTYSEANGGTIDLELKPQVVDEPTWKNYGMKIPFSGNAAAFPEKLPDPPSFTNDPSPDLVEKITASYWTSVANLLDSLTGTSKNITYYEAPMEQPFFHVRSIDSKVSITPGATVVMGGLITEQRKAMDDKVPFLGDLPFVGRLFRSHAEQTMKRNLLIFVTGRLITPSGRELRMGEERHDDAEVKAAPQAE